MTVITKLTPADICAAAQAHGLEFATLHAVLDVESGGNGFLPDGRVKILFERHILWKRLLTPDRQIDPHPFAAAHPDLCGLTWNATKYPYGSEEYQWDRVQAVLDWASANAATLFESYKKATYEACSWGLFQLLGQDYSACDYDDVYPFVHAMEAGEPQQLATMLTWISGNGLLDRLRRKDWTAFARGYNGSGKVAAYAAKLELAYHCALRLAVI